jgi:hypothetical protein
MLLISFSEMRDDSLEIEKGSTGVAWPSSARVIDVSNITVTPRSNLGCEIWLISVKLLNSVNLRITLN